MTALPSGFIPKPTTTMRSLHKTALLGAFTAVMLASCDSNFETFEPEGYTGTPAAIAESAIHSEALPGQIQLSWDMPSTPTFDYMQIKYHDPWADKDVTEVVSKYTTSLTVDKTLKRFGDYTFYFQTFNDLNEGGPVTTVKAQSGAYPAEETVTKSEVKLTADQLSSNYPEPSEGPLKNLIDGNVNTFFHSRWSSPQYALPHWIQINFNEDHENFVVYYQNRNGSQVGPQELEFQISNDGETWETVSTITEGLPSGSKAEYTSDLVRPGKTFRFFRYNVTKTYGNKKYFNLAEMKFYDAQISVYDPENDPLE